MMVKWSKLSSVLLLMINLSQLSRIENLLDKELNPRQTQVCLHEKTRLEVGDRWLDGLNSCVCTEVSLHIR